MGQITIREANPDMPYHIERFPDLPVVVISYEDHFLFSEHGADLAKDLLQTLDAQSEPIYFINQNPLSKMGSFNELLQAVNSVTRGERPLLKHHNLKKPIWVTTSRLAITVAAGLNTVTFGNVEVLVFATLEEALNWVRTNAA